MSRTMDAFDMRMHTFGGRQSSDKTKNFGKFIAEKRGFLRVSNNYLNADPQKIVKQEMPKIV